MPLAARWIDPGSRGEPLKAYARETESRTLELLDRSLGPGQGRAPSATIQRSLLDSAARDIADLLPQLEPRAREMAGVAAAKLRERGEREARDLREILERKQINVVSSMLRQWCTNVMRSKVEPMKDVARMIRRHFDGIVAWTQTRQSNGFLEALNGLFQAAKRKARGYGRFETMRAVLFLIAGKLDFRSITPHVA